MKILFITQHYMPFVGGIEIYINKISNILRKKGHNIHVISSLSDKKKKFESIKGVKVHRLPSKKHFMHRFTSLDKLEETIKKINPDVIQFFAHGHLFFYSAAKLAKKLEIPYSVLSFGPIGVARTANAKSFFQDWLFDTFYTPFIYRNAKTVFYRIPDTKGWCIKKGAQKTVFLPSGIIKDFFGKVNSTQLKKKFKGKKVVLFVGRVCKDKGVDTLVEAFGEVNEKSPDSHLIIFGARDKDFTKTLKARISQLNLTKKVSFMGPVPFGKEKEIIKLMDVADIFVLPSKHEGFGQVLAQAMARSKPVVTTKVGAIPSWVSSKNGFLVKCGNISTLSKSITKLLKNKKLSKRIGTHNKKYAKKYLLESQIDVLLKNYKKR